MEKKTDILKRKRAAKRVVEFFGGATKVAYALGYSDIRNVAYWTRGERWFTPKHCVTIERLTAGQITRKELRPHDFADHWPDLTPDTVEA